MNCARCPRELVQQRAWQKVTPEQRAAWLAEGKSVLQGRGLCRGCYLKAWKAGEIAHRRRGVGGRGRTSGQIHPCSRCGVKTRDEMCRDCREVVAA